MANALKDKIINLMSNPNAVFMVCQNEHSNKWYVLEHFTDSPTTAYGSLLRGPGTIRVSKKISWKLIEEKEGKGYVEKTRRDFANLIKSTGLIDSETWNLIVNGEPTTTNVRKTPPQKTIVRDNIQSISSKNNDIDDGSVIEWLVG